MPRSCPALPDPRVGPGLCPGARLACEEVFGPVATLDVYDDVGAGLAGINGSAYGLQASFFTRDVRTLMRAHETLEVGAVIHDDWPLFRVDSMPYGGTKASGWGREGVRYAIEEFTEPRLLVTVRALISEERPMPWGR